MTNEQLASECRRWKVAALVLTFALGLVLAVSARADLPYPDRIRARTLEVDEFVLKDAAGNVRARMSTDGKGTQLIIGKQRNGPTGKLELAFLKSCTRFETLAPEGYSRSTEQPF